MAESRTRLRCGAQRWLALALCLAGSCALAAAPRSLTQISLQSVAQSAVLSLTFSVNPTARLMRLHSPERLVVDLADTRRAAPLPSVPSDGVVTALRSGHPRDGTLRLVLELKAPLRSHLERSSSAAGFKLQILLGPRGGEAARQLADTAVAEPEPPDAPGIVAAHAPSGARTVIVAVDAGHGGQDPGATGRNGTHEKDVTLAIARALAARINREPGMRAVLTRDGDYFVALRDRMVRARAAHADMFVSIHADAVRDRAVSGASVYILSERGASSEAARMLAEQENAADLKGGIALADQKPDLRSVLLDLSQSASIGESVEAAGRVLSALDHVGAVRKHEVQQAAFVVLKSPDIPSMLVESAYISNPLEERRLCTPGQQQRLAEAIFSGIGSYFRHYPPEGSLFARARTGVGEGSSSERGVALVPTS